MLRKGEKKKEEITCDSGYIYVAESLEDERDIVTACCEKRVNVMVIIAKWGEGVRLREKKNRVFVRFCQSLAIGLRPRRVRVINLYEKCGLRQTFCIRTSI